MANVLKGAITIGFLYIPVGFYNIKKEFRIKLHYLCKESHDRVRQRKYCPSCNKEITSHDMIKGYEFEKCKYVTITKEDLEKIKPKKDKIIHIEQVAKMIDIESMYFDKYYYVLPEAGAEKSYEILRQALFSKNKVAMAQMFNELKEEFLVIYPTKEYLIAKVLYYKEEIQEMPKSIKKVEPSKAELDMVKQLIDSMTGNFDISAYHDTYQELLQEIIKSKINRQEIVTTHMEDKTTNS